MFDANLSPAKALAEKRAGAKKITLEICDKIFELGVEETALKFGIKPEEAVKLAYKGLRKNGGFDRFEELVSPEKLTAVCDKIMELGTLSEAKIFENSEKIAEKWEIVAAKYIFKERLRLENID